MWLCAESLRSASSLRPFKKSEVQRLLLTLDAGRYFHRALRYAPRAQALGALGPKLATDLSCKVDLFQHKKHDPSITASNWKTHVIVRSFKPAQSLTYHLHPEKQRNMRLRLPFWSTNTSGQPPSQAAWAVSLHMFQSTPFCCVLEARKPRDAPRSGEHLQTKMQAGTFGKCGEEPKLFEDVFKSNDLHYLWTECELLFVAVLHGRLCHAHNKDFLSSAAPGAHVLIQDRLIGCARCARLIRLLAAALAATFAAAFASLAFTAGPQLHCWGFSKGSSS